LPIPLRPNFKSLQPVLQGLGVVRAEVLNIENAELPWLEDIHYLAERRRIRAREYALSCPITEGALPITSDGLEQAASGMVQRTVDDPPHLHVVLRSNVFEHSHGHESHTLRRCFDNRLR